MGLHMRPFPSYSQWVMHPACSTVRWLYSGSMNPDPFPIVSNASALCASGGDTCGDKSQKMKTFIVEDNATIRDNLISTLEELAPVEAVGSAETAEEGAAWLNGDQSQWDLAIVDLFLKSGTGLGVLKACQKRNACQKLVVFSNYATREMRLRCAELGADAIFDKSTEIDDLLTYCHSHSRHLACSS